MAAKVLNTTVVEIMKWDSAFTMAAMEATVQMHNMTAAEAEFQNEAGKGGARA